ncbi:hydrogenase maturation protease [Corynebacterium sp. 335C]
MTPRATVLGVGNPVMGDDATGLALLRLLRDDVAGARRGPGPAPGADALVGLSSLAGPGAPSEPGLGDPGAPGVVGRGTVGGMDVEFVEGGTSGLELVDVVAGADSLLVLDAVTGMGEPGTVVELEGDQVPRMLKARLSPHQVGLLDLLATAKLLGREPRRLAVVAVEAKSADMVVGLSDEVAAALPEAAARARARLDAWAAEGE